MWWGGGLVLMGLTLSYRQLKAILIMASKEIFIDVIINIAGDMCVKKLAYYWLI